MKNKDTILLENIYTNNVLNKRLEKNKYPNKIDAQTLGAEEESIQIDYNGDLYFVDLEYNPPQVTVNIGDDPEDHIVQITSENNPEVYQTVVTHAMEKRDDERHEEEMRNPRDPNADNPFHRNYEG